MMAWKPTVAAAPAQHRHVSNAADERTEAIQKVASAYMGSAKFSQYMSLSPTIDDEQSTTLAGMKASTVEVIREEQPRVRAIRLGLGATLSDVSLAADTIYERDFYPQLVRDMRTAKLRVLLLGNSGVGKSTFQFYLLARYMNPEHFQDMGSAPPSRRIQFGSAAPPKVVIRHLPGRDQFHVLFLEKCVAHRVRSGDVLDCFDPATTLYFFEPGSTTTVEPKFEGLKLPTLATLSPSPVRYKEFAKRARTMYFPVYAKEELLAIGRDMRQPARCNPDDLGDLYSDDNISQRFDLYNGIFRYVIPESETDAELTLTARENYLRSLDPIELVDKQPSELIHRVAGTFALLYDVYRREDGEWNFLEHTFKYAGSDVVSTIQETYKRADFAGLLRAVRLADEYSKKPGDNVSWMFEEVVARYLTAESGVCWELRPDGKCAAKVPPRLEGKLRRSGGRPKYDEMKINTLYRPLDSKYPCCDMMYKDEEGTLVCIQVSWSHERTVDKGPLGKFCHAVGLCADKGGDLTDAEADRVKERVLFVFCPRPRLYPGARLRFETDRVLEGGAVMCMGEWFTSGIEGMAS
jgi:hypothetical protein